MHTSRWLDRSFIASVQALMRADGRDQAEWTARRRQRLKFGGSGNKPSRVVVTKGNSTSSKIPKSEKCQHNRRRQQPRGNEDKAASGEKKETKNREAPSPTEAMIRVGQLKSTLGRALDPPAVAAELATLYLVLSDQRGALESFQLAVKPSPGESHLKEIDHAKATLTE